MFVYWLCSGGPSIDVAEHNYEMRILVSLYRCSHMGSNIVSSLIDDKS